MAKNTIKIKNYLKVVEEYVANAAITPGMLIELMSTDKVRAHANAGQNAITMFALEDELQGKGIDEDYAAADPVQCWVATRGDIVYALLADGENVAIGDFLESNGDGQLKKHTADVVQGGSSGELVADVSIYTNQIIGIALDAIDISDSSGAESSGPQGYDKRILVRII